MWKKSFAFLNKIVQHAHVGSVVIITCYILLAFRQIQMHSVTFDEPTHIRSGLEWLTQGYAPSDPFNPPLSKIPFAIVQLFGVNLLADPYLHVARFVSVGITAGFLFFFYFWIQKTFSKKIALLSLVFLIAEPSVIGYTSLATTEAMSLFVVFFVFTAAIAAIRKKNLFRLSVFIVSLILLYLTKTVFLAAFVPLFIIVFLQYKKAQWNIFFYAGVITFAVFLVLLILLSGAHAYRFLGISFPGVGVLKTTLSALSFVFNPKYAPTRSFIFFGHVYEKGTYLYMFVVLFLKTTPQLLLLSAWFIIAKIYKKSMAPRFALLTVISFFIVVVLGNYNVGERHILPILPFLALFGALAFQKIFIGTKQPAVHYLLIIVLTVFFIGSAFTQDTIAYITPFIGQQVGGNIIGDSNFDWGQSLPILAKEFPHIDYIVASSVADPALYGIHALPFTKSMSPQQFQGKNIFISRTIYIKEQFSKINFFAEKNAVFVANGTFLLFR